MRTITEFFGKALKTIEEKLPTITAEATVMATETLKAEGKTEEETTAALPEAVKAAVAAKLLETDKLEGDKLAMCLAAIEAMRGQRGGSLKRVIVMVPGEGEKAPSGAREIDGKFYLAEFFPEASRPAAAPSKDDRFGGKGKRGGKGGRDGKGGGRDGKPAGRGDGRSAEGRGDRPERPQTPSNGVVIGVKAGGIPGATAPGHVAVPRGEGRPPRAPRAPKAPRAPVEPYTGPNRIVIGGAPVASAAPTSADANTDKQTDETSA